MALFDCNKFHRWNYKSSLDGFCISQWIYDFDYVWMSEKIQEYQKYDLL